MRAVVRTARTRDIPGVLALWGSARAAVGSRPDTAASVTRLIVHADDALLVAEDDGEIVGTLIAAWDGFRGNMYRLSVLPARRRHGIGRALVEVAHERLAAKGASRITALVAEHELGAAQFWHELGYERDTQVVRYVRGR